MSFKVFQQILVGLVRQASYHY